MQLKQGQKEQIKTYLVGDTYKLLNMGKSSPPTLLLGPQANQMVTPVDPHEGSSKAVVCFGAGFHPPLQQAGSSCSFWYVSYAQLDQETFYFSEQLQQSLLQQVDQPIRKDISGTPSLKKVYFRTPYPHISSPIILYFRYCLWTKLLTPVLQGQDASVAVTA